MVFFSNLSVCNNLSILFLKWPFNDLHCSLCQHQSICLWQCLKISILTLWGPWCFTNLFGMKWGFHYFLQKTWMESKISSIAFSTFSPPPPLSLSLLSPHLLSLYSPLSLSLFNSHTLGILFFDFCVFIFKSNYGQYKMCTLTAENCTHFMRINLSPCQWKTP